MNLQISEQKVKRSLGSKVNNVVGCSIGSINVPTFNLSIQRVCELRDATLEIPERVLSNLQNKF